ncbi:uncharacterized protein ACJ7VT_012106 [Polymixia lowei]
MESNLSCLSSPKEEVGPFYIQPHYKETYRLAIYALLCGGKDSYEEFLKAEQINHFLSEEEILFILENAELPASDDDSEGKDIGEDSSPSTYFPTESDEEVPDLDLGWPEVTHERTDTNISLLFHPPRQNTPTIKEVIRKQIQDAKQVIAIAMDVFTDVDIFKEIISATLRGVVVYILLDDSQFNCFFNMSASLGIKLQDLRNLRVRTVKGQQYQCRNAAKFHGALEERFILVDCKTILYGTYSYTWSFEKINLSMVLVITGQLVGSYDEEFRRLFARSIVPVALSSDRESEQPLRDTVPLCSPNSSQVSLHQIHMRSRVTHGLRSAKEDRFNNEVTLTRRLSVQERLHHSHRPDVANLVRGHSYAGELQWLKSTTRLKTASRDASSPVAPERTGYNLQRSEDPLLTGKGLLHKHRSRYGADQHLIPFNSETSLHRWKIDSYFSNSDAPVDAPYDITSPQGSQLGLNDNQSPLVLDRSRNIKSRLEEIRLKRLSLQDYTNPRHSQESLLPIFSTLERSKTRSSLRALEKSQSMAELDENIQHRSSLEPDNQRDEGSFKPRHELEKEGVERGTEREQPLADGQRCLSHYDIKTVSERKSTRTSDWHEPLSRTTSAANLDMKLKEPSLKSSNLRPSGVNTQHSRAMESLLEIPEEKDGLTKRNHDSINKIANSLDSVAHKDENQTTSKEEKDNPKVSSVVSNMSAGTQHQDLARGSHDSMSKMSKSLGPADLKDGKKTTSGEEATVPKLNVAISNMAVGSQDLVKAKCSIEKVQTQQEEPTLQRKNSMRSKVYSMLALDERKLAKKEEKSLQRKNSMRSETPLESNQQVQVEISVEQRTISQASPVEKPCALEQTPLQNQSASVSMSHNAIADLAETERHKSLFSIDRFSPQRSSKRMMSIVTEQDRGSRVTLDGEGSSMPQARREKAYSRFEHFINAEINPPDKPVRTTSMYSSDKDRNSFINSPRHQSAGTTRYSMYQTQNTTDNRLGRFMQRVGYLIGKNK